MYMTYNLYHDLLFFKDVTYYIYFGEIPIHIVKKYALSKILVYNQN